MSKVDDLITYARDELGKPYVFGAEGPSSFDCSGLMQFIFSKIGITLPRIASSQQDFVSKVTNPQPGDLVFWGDPAYHVALYVGDGKIIAAPEPGDVVKIQNVYGTPTYGRVPGLGVLTDSVISGARLGLTTVAERTTGDAIGAFVVKLIFGAAALTMTITGMAMLFKDIKTKAGG
jgi:hypothetical protein